jgi:3-oxoacyl-(acyl-carrier-protein) synthase
LLDKTGSVAIEKIDAGCNFRRQREAADCVAKVFEKLGATDDDLVVASANGTFVDAAESAAVARYCPAASIYAPKAALGESVGASSIWQVICAAQALRTELLPPLANVSKDPDAGSPRAAAHSAPFRRAIVSECGMNQQVAGLALRASTDAGT